MDQTTARRVFNQWLLREKICQLSDAQSFYNRLFNTETTDAEGISAFECVVIFIRLAFHAFLDYCATSFSLFGLKLQSKSVIDNQGKSEYISIVRSEFKIYFLTVSSAIQFRIVLLKLPLNLLQSKLSISEIWYVFVR